ncbi:hypothetical protein, partial [Burkholderia stabilis]
MLSSHLLRRLFNNVVLATVTSLVGCIIFRLDHSRIGFLGLSHWRVLEGVSLSAERSEDGASGWYTAPLGGEWCQNH